MEYKNIGNNFIFALLTVASVAIFTTSGSLSSVASEAPPPEGSICVTAKFEKAPEINARKCYIAGEATSSIPSDDVGEDEAPDSVYKKIIVGNESMTIWQSEIDHSNKNKELMAVGRADEMTAYPGDNWKTIESNNEDLDKATVIYYSIDPEQKMVQDDLLPETFSRNGDMSVYYDNRVNGARYLMSSKNAKLHSYDDRPAFYEWIDATNDGIAMYYIDGEHARIDGKPNMVSYLNNIVSIEDYVKNSPVIWHRTEGPARITYDNAGRVSKVEYFIEDELITNREDWISKGGEAEGWDDYH